MIAVSYVARFREAEGRQNDMVTWASSWGASWPRSRCWRRPSTISSSTRKDLLPGRLGPLDREHRHAGHGLQLAGDVDHGVRRRGVCHLPDPVPGRPQPAGGMALGVGVYLAIAGAVVFACGIALSVYRERLLQLPEKIANREGVFKVLSWR